MTILPSDFECHWSLSESECWARQEKFTIDEFTGVVSCQLCGLMIEVQTDLEGGVMVDDAYSSSSDDDDDGNADNPEFNNVEDILEGEGAEWTPEETMYNEIKQVMLSIANEFSEYPGINLDEIEDVDEKRHYEEMGNESKGYAGYIFTNLESLASLYMHFTKYGINVFPERVPNRREYSLTVIALHRIKNNNILNIENMLRFIGEKPRTIIKQAYELARITLAEDKSEVEFYIELYGQALGFSSDNIRSLVEEWEKDREPEVIAEAQVKALAFLLSGMEHLFNEKKTLTEAVTPLGLNRNTVSRVKKRYDDFFKTIKPAL